MYNDKAYDNCKAQAYQSNKLSSPSPTTLMEQDLGTCRISSAELFRSRAQRMFQKAHEYENLAKLFDTLPKEIEAALFPLIENSLFTKD